MLPPSSPTSPFTHKHMPQPRSQGPVCQVYCAPLLKGSKPGPREPVLNICGMPPAPPELKLPMKSSIPPMPPNGPPPMPPNGLFPPKNCHEICRPRMAPSKDQTASSLCEFTWQSASTAAAYLLEDVLRISHVESRGSSREAAATGSATPIGRGTLLKALLPKHVKHFALLWIRQHLCVRRAALSHTLKLSSLSVNITSPALEHDMQHDMAQRNTLHHRNGRGGGGVCHSRHTPRKPV